MPTLNKITPEKTLVNDVRQDGEPSASELKGLMAFAAFLMQEHRDELCDVGGGEIQDAAEKYGLLKSVMKDKPCGEGCRCAEWTNDFPCECFVDSPLLTKCYAVLNAQKAEASPQLSEVVNENASLRARVATLEAENERLKGEMGPTPFPPCTERQAAQWRGEAGKAWWHYFPDDQRSLVIATRDPYAGFVIGYLAAAMNRAQEVTRLLSEVAALKEQLAKEESLIDTMEMRRSAAHDKSLKVARAAWEAGFRLCRVYGDNAFHFDGEQKERQWQIYLNADSKTSLLPADETEGAPSSV